MVTMGLKYQYYMLPNPSLKVSSIEKMLLIGQLLELLENKTIDALVGTLAHIWTVVLAALHPQDVVC